MRWPAPLALRFAKDKPRKEVARFVASISLVDLALVDVRFTPKSDIRNVSDYGPNRLRSARLAQEVEGAGGLELIKQKTFPARLRRAPTCH